MEEIKKFKPWKIIIVFIALIIGSLLIRNFLIKSSDYAGNLEELTCTLTSKGYKVNEIREIKMAKEIVISKIPKMEKEIAIDNLSISIMIFANNETAKDTLNLISENGDRIGHAFQIRLWS